MTLVIAEPCIDVKDKACVEVCPMDCIYHDGPADRMLYINPMECIDCGACEIACPVAALFFEDELPARWAEFKGLNALYFEDKEAVRGQINQRYLAKIGASTSEKPAGPS